MKKLTTKNGNYFYYKIAGCGEAVRLYDRDDNSTFLTEIPKSDVFAPDISKEDIDVACVAVDGIKGILKTGQVDCLGQIVFGRQQQIDGAVSTDIRHAVQIA